MKQFTFSHYLVDEGNRDAFEIARCVADLEPVSPLPILLLGEDGCGKTHLLYAIVNRLRASSARTGLAYVTAHDFPEQVRRLIDDPTDVQRAQSAVLLIDQLEKVDAISGDSTLLEELEAVVRIFLDNGHYVIMASAVHPERLRNLTEGLREYLVNGQIIPMHSQDPAKRAEIIEQRVRRELAEMLESQRQEIAALKSSAPAAGSPNETEREDWQRRLDVAKAFGESLQRDLESARAEVTQLRQGVNDEAAAELADVVAEASTLRDERDALRDELGRLHEVVAELEHASVEKQELLREAENFRQQAKSSRDEYESTRQQLLALEATSKHVEAEFAALRAEAASHASAQAALTELQAELAELRAESAKAADAEQRVAELEQQLAQSRAENEDAREEAGRLLERAEGLLAMVETNRARFAEVDSAQRSQIEELERLIAERTAEAVRAEELEAAKAQALAALEQIEQQRTAYDERIQDLERQLGERHAEADGIRDALDRVAAERDTLRQEWEAERARLEQTWSEERAAIMQEHEAAREAHAQLAVERDRAHADLSGLMAERDRLHSQLGETSGERSRLEETIQQLEAELDSLRHEAAGQVAAAHAQAGELEGRLVRMESAFERLRTAADKVSANLLDFATEMRSGAAGLVDTAGRLSAQAETAVEPSGLDSFPNGERPVGGPVSNGERSGLLDVVQDVTDDEQSEDGAAFDDFPGGDAPSNGHGDLGHEDAPDMDGAQVPAGDGDDDAYTNPREVV